VNVILEVVPVTLPRVTASFSLGFLAEFRFQVSPHTLLTIARCSHSVLSADGRYRPTLLGEGRTLNFEMVEAALG
jgi:hypothetical protein